MRLQGKLLQDITIQDVQQLIDNRVSESTTLEYKAELPGNKDSDKKEFLADVTAFANRSGGVIVYGLQEGKDEQGRNTGTADKIVGLGSVNCDQVIQRLDQIILSGVAPKLPPVNFRFVPAGDPQVLLVDISRSLFAPHIIWFDRCGKFYVRTNSGKEQMDVHQIREAFLQSDAWLKQADNFRRMRIMTVECGELIARRFKKPLYIVHIVPIGPRPNELTVSDIRRNQSLLKTNRYEEWTTSINVDGCLSYRAQGKPTHRLIFRNGGIEYIISVPTDKGVVQDTEETKVEMLNGKILEDYTSEWLKSYSLFASELDIEPPLAVFVSLIDVKGKHLFYALSFTEELGVDYPRFDRDDILLPGIIVTDLGRDLDLELESILDWLWQAAGREQWPGKAARQK